MRADTDKPTTWTPTKVQLLFRHQNCRYYVGPFAAGKEKWTSLKTTLLPVVKNRRKEEPEAGVYLPARRLHT